MLRQICRQFFNKSNNVWRSYSSVDIQKSIIPKDYNIEEANDENEDKSVLVPHKNEDLSNIDTYLKPTFNFAAYINKSETLQELVKLGVNLDKLERHKEAAPFILGLKFENIKDHIIFIRELGVENDLIGGLITKNPFILREDLNNIQTRINYFKYKQFTDESIKSMVQRNPFLLSHSTQYIDEKLGFFQKKFHLTGNQVRLLAARRPQLITYPEDKIKVNMFVLKEEMGFTPEEMKKILLDAPKVYTKSQFNILQTFEYVHKTMGIRLERIVETPAILTWRKRRLMERHMFLEQLGRAQYDPTKPNYVGLFTLVSGEDSHFCTEVAKSSVHAYNAFLKTF